MWACFQEIVVNPALLSVTEPAARVSTEHLSIHIHPSYLNSQPQRAASRASTIPVFHLRQLRLNLSLLLLCFSDCLFHCRPLCRSQVPSIVLVAFYLFPLSLFLPRGHHQACCPPHWSPGPGSGPCNVLDRKFKAPDWLAGLKMPPY